jgi:CubicO group peptidase (beta-lactamase class C family)
MSIRNCLVRILVLFVSLAGTGVAYSDTPQRAALEAGQVAAIDAVGRTSITAHAAPGLTIAVARDGQIVYNKGFGYRDVARQLSPDATTRYPIGSNTKQFTAAAILLLRDEGKLILDKPLAMYLPQIPHGREVTIRQLLTMTGGYAEYTELGEFNELVKRPATAARVVGTVVHRPLAFTPGSRYSYSNTGYMLLQMVIERISGTTYANFLRQRIFRPLGMHATYVRASHDSASNVAVEYTSFALGPWERAERWDYTWVSGAGGIVSDVTDLEKWNAGLDGHKLLSAHSFDQMTKPGTVDGKPNPSGYGFGITTARMPNGHRIIWHGGNTSGASTQDARFPDDHLAIIVLANSGFYNTNGAVEAIYGILVPQPSAEKPSGAKPPALSGADPAMIKAATSWLDGAIAGRIDDAGVRADFRKQLTPPHRAALHALAKNGSRTYTLLGIDRRAPTTVYQFRLETPARTLLYAYMRDDAGSVASVVIIPWLVFPKESEPTPAPPLSPEVSVDQPSVKAKPSTPASRS